MPSSYPPSRASDYTHGRVPTIAARSSLEDAFYRLEERHRDQLPVVDDDGRLVGVIRRVRLLEGGYFDPAGGGRRATLRLPAGTVADLMDGNPPSAPFEVALADALRALLSREDEELYLVAEGRPKAGITLTDALQALVDRRLAMPVGDLVGVDPPTISVVEPIDRATEKLGRVLGRTLVVMEGRFPVGLYGRSESALARAFGARTPVEEVMRPACVRVPRWQPAHRVAAELRTCGADTALVMEGDAMIATVARRRLLELSL